MRDRKPRPQSRSQSPSKTSSRTPSKPQPRSTDRVSKAPKRPRLDTEEATGPVRLNKAIADAGVSSRRHADELIEQGKVKINGKVCTELGTKITPADTVTVNGEPITRKKHLTYILLNKPKDVISTSQDEKGRTTVFDIVKLHVRLFTVGRLDRNTTGVLLLTNDGELANRLMHPSYGIPRIYRAGLDKPLTLKHAKEISNGIDLEDGPTQPCEIAIDQKDSFVAHIQLREGRNREVRRIFEHFGYEVKRLDRKGYAFLTPRGLARGEYRHLTRDEVQELRKLVKTKI